ncbi:hypothetical protein E2C01_052576 [Portunus trituberculatus]|uniref:Uncharacterized protein n=1 Tax=Portunus trituberculatus TaxID=210409 RepID=A0A5B7GLV9_PORTR|nr:hypothetical protein [Portunus trituberculatus]
MRMLMATFEVNDRGICNINQVVVEQVIPHWTLESVKGARKGQRYRSLLMDLSSGPRRIRASPPLPSGPPEPTLEKAVTPAY